MSPIKNRYSVEETVRVEYSECANNLFLDGSLGNMTAALSVSSTRGAECRLEEKQH